MSKSNQEEHEVLNAFEAGELKRSESAGRIKKQHQEYAEAMPRKYRVSSIDWIETVSLLSG